MEVKCATSFDERFDPNNVLDPKTPKPLSTGKIFVFKIKMLPKKSNVNVAVRIRPALEREISQDGVFHSCVAN